MTTVMEKELLDRYENNVRRTSKGKKDSHYLFEAVSMLWS